MTTYNDFFYQFIGTYGLYSGQISIALNYKFFLTYCVQEVLSILWV